MSRSVWKGPFVDNSLIRQVRKIGSSGTKGNRMIKTWSRRSVIIPEFLGLTFAVHNGNKFIPVSVTEEHLGMKLGEFSPSKTFKGHSGDKKVGKGGSKSGGSKPTAGKSGGSKSGGGKK